MSRGAVAALVALLLSVSVPVSGAAQSPAVTAAAEDVDVALGLREAAELAVAGADTTGPRIADLRVKEERGRLWPSLSVQGRVSSESLDTASTTTQSQFGIAGTVERYGGDLVFSTNLLQFLETLPRVDAALAEQRAARLRLTHEQNDRLLRAVEAYLTLASERETLVSLESLRREQREFLKRQEDRASKDAIPMVELIRARGEAISLDREYLAARHHAAAAELTLRKLTGLKPQQRITLAFVPDSLDLSFIDGEGLSGLLALARENNPRLLAANATVERARAEAQASRSANYPSLSLNGAVGYGHVTETDGGTFEHTGPRHSVFLTLGIPLFDGGVRKSQIAQAETRAEARLHEAQQTAEDIKTQIEQEYWSFREREEAAELLSKQVALAEDELYQTAARSEGGVSAGADPLSVLSKLARLRSELGRTRAELEVRGVALAVAVGRNPFQQATGPSSAPPPTRRPPAPGAIEATDGADGLQLAIEGRR